MAITKRADKGSALSYDEMDANFDAVAPRDSATGAIEIPTGTTGQQPASPVIGQLRFNTQLNLFEGYFASVGWSTLAAAAVSGEVNQNAWAEITVAGQSNVVADQKSDVLSFVAGTNISITTNATNDSITFNNTFSQDFSYSSLSGAPTNVSTFTNDAGYLTSETTTTLTSDSVNTKLVYTDETGTANDVDLSWAIDDTNLARITSGTVDGGTGIATFTRDDATNFTVDFSALFDDTNLTRITSGSFDSGTGDITLTRSDATTAATISLDGRYLLSSSAITTGDITVENASAVPEIFFKRTGALATNDSVGLLQYQGENSSGTNTVMAQINSIVNDNTINAIESTLSFQVRRNNVMTDVLTLDGSNDEVAIGLPVRLLANVALQFEGTQNNLNQTSLTATNPSADRTITLPDRSGTVALTSDLYSDSAVNSHLNTNTASSGEVLSWTGTDFDWIAQASGGGDLVDDTTPQLGGNLDLNGNIITSSTNIILDATSTAGYVGINKTTANAGTLLLAADATGTPSSSANNWAYIGVERGNSPNVFIRWNEGSDRWEFTNNGSTYYSFPTSSSNPTLNNVLATGNESTNQIKLYRTTDGVQGGALRFESRDNSPLPNQSYGEIEWHGDTDADTFTNTLGLYARIQGLGKTVGTTSNFGQIKLQATENGTITDMMYVGHTFYHPNDPQSNYYGVHFPHHPVSVQGNLYITDEVDNTSDMTSDSSHSINFVAHNSAGNLQTRTQIWNQNNMLRMTAHNRNELNPQWHYNQLTLSPSPGTSMFSITTVNIETSSINNYDIWNDYNAASKVWYTIFQPQGSDPPLRHANYTTTQRNALLVGAGTVIWNTTDTKLQVYDGSNWQNLH